MPTRIGLLLSLLAVPSLAQVAGEEDVRKSFAAQKERAGVVAERGEKPHYTRKFDLSGLPHYVPQKQLTGWIRLHGSNYLVDGKLGEYWRDGFAKVQPRASGPTSPFTSTDSTSATTPRPTSPTRCSKRATSGTRTRLRFNSANRCRYTGAPRCQRRIVRIRAAGLGDPIRNSPWQKRGTA